jgi:hypothetical protein
MGSGDAGAFEEGVPTTFAPGQPAYFRNFVQSRATVPTTRTDKMKSKPRFLAILTKTTAN